MGVCMKIIISKKLAAVGGALLGAMLVATPVLADNLLVKDAQDAARPGAVAAAPNLTPDCHFFSATNSATQRRVLTNNTPFVNTSTAWTDLPCGSTTVTVPRGHSALAVVKAEPPA